MKTQRDNAKGNGERRPGIGGRVIAVAVSAALGGASLWWALPNFDWPLSKLWGAAGHPSEWDPRVGELANFVERNRGLQFKHPVLVEFLSSRDYSEAARSSPEDLTDDDRESDETYNAWFHSLGLVQKSVDLAKAHDDLTGEETLGFYDEETESIAVRGTRIGTEERITLVHELTHALQDQHFDMSRAADFLSDGEDVAFTALIEGDATRIENIYIGTLSDEEQEEYFAEPGPSAASPLPPALEAFFDAPYTLGEQFVYFVEARGGNQAVDRAFRRLPETEEHLSDPFTYAAREKAKPVPVPRLNNGERELASGDFGAVAWLVLLSQYIDPRDALGAVDGWGGDAFVTFRRKGQACTKAVFKGDTDRDTAEMAAALQRWKASSPAARAAGTRRGAVHIESCSTEVPPPPTGPQNDPFLAPYVRSGVAADLLRAGTRPEIARCVAQAVVTGLTVPELREAMDAGLGQGGGQQQIDLVAGQCSPGPLPRLE